MPVPQDYDPKELDPPSDNLRAKDFPIGTKWTLKIRDVAVELMKPREGESGNARKKLVFWFEDKEKRYVLNQGARAFMEDNLGMSPNAWVGATIQLGVFRVPFGDDLVPGFKITAVKAAEGQPQQAAEDSTVPF